MPRAAAVRIAREIGSQLVEAVSSRAEGGAGTHLTIGGLSLTGGGTLEEPDATRPLGLPEWNSRQAIDAATRTMTREQLLHDSAFSVSSGSAGPGGRTLAAWGHVASSRFDAEEDSITLDGEVVTGLLGAEAERNGVLAGIIVSHSKSDTRFKGEGEIAGQIESRLTGLYPYARVDLTERVAGWAVAGAGSGELTLRPRTGTALVTDQSMRMGAIGVRGRVLEPTERGGLGVNLRGDAMWVRAKTDRVDGLVATEADATRLRAIVEAERAYETGTGATVTPTGQVGIRLDGGDAETGAGLELGAGIRYNSGPVTLEGQVRGLVAHEESGYKEWGASAAVRVEPRQGGRGLSLSVAPVWGEAAGGAEHLWSARNARELDPDRAFEPEARLEAEVGYGVAVPHSRGLVTPYTGLTLAGEGSRTLQAGARWYIAPGTAMGLQGTRKGDGDHAVEVRLQVTW